MVIRIDKPVDVALYPIRTKANHKYLDTAIAFSKLIEVLPDNGKEARNASNYMVLQANTMFCNFEERTINAKVAEALKVLLDAIKSDLEKANKDGLIDGTNVIKRLLNGSISMDELNNMVTLGK